MEFFERRPIFSAVQFSGQTEIVRSMSEIADIHTLALDYGPCGFTLVINLKLHDGQKEFAMNQGDWLLRSPDGEVSVITDGEKRRRFEACSQ